MSTNPIIIEIVDKIDSSIAGKIKAIGIAARQTNNDLNNLQATLNNVSGGTTKLSQALQNIPAKLQPAIKETNRFAEALGFLLGRVIGTEAGFSMLGGAFSRTISAVVGIIPLIAGAAIIGALVGVVIWMNKVYDASRKIVASNTELFNHFADQRDKLLSLQETYAGLVDGPMARYSLALANFAHRSVVVDISQINTVLEDQQSKWSRLVSWVERYGSALMGLAGNSTTTFAGAKQAGNFDIKGAQAVIADIKEAMAEANDAGKGQQGLRDALQKTGDELKKWHEAEANVPKDVLAIMEVGRKGIQNFYRELRDQQAISNQELKNLRLEAAGETLAEMKQAASNQLKEFNREVDAFKAAGGIKTAQDELALREAQKAGKPRASLIGPSQPALPLNQGTLIQDTNKLTTEINNQGDAIDILLQKYHNSVDKATAYTEAARAAAEAEKILTEIEAKRIPITDALRQKVNDFATAEERQRVNNKVNEELRQYNITLDSQISLLGKYGEALTVATEVESLRRKLQKEGRDLDQQQITQLTQTLTDMQRQKQVQSELNTIWGQTIGQQLQLAARQTALNRAYQEGIISLTQYKTASLQVALSLNELLNNQGLGNLKTHVEQVLGSLIQNFKGFKQEATIIWSGFFQSLEKGFANSIGKALVYNEDLKKALLDTARNAVAQLISSLIELGLQLLIVTALQKVFKIHLPSNDGDTTKQTIKNTAVSLASIAIVTAAELEAISLLQGPAWELAEAISLISFGANAAGAVAGIAAVVAAGAAAQGAKFYGGGFVNGQSGLDKIPAWLTRGEFVMNEQATSRNRPFLESMNAGASAVRSNGSVGTGTKLNVTVMHDGTTGIQVQQLDESTVRIIAKQESRTAVQQFAPQVIATDLHNPNSRTSKAVSLNVEAKRKR